MSSSENTDQHEGINGQPWLVGFVGGVFFFFFSFDFFFFLPVLLSAGRCSHSGNAPCARLTTSVNIHLILIGVLEDFNVELSAILSGLTQDVLPSHSTDMLGQHSTDTLIMYCFYIHIYMQTHARTQTHTQM